MDHNLSQTLIRAYALQIRARGLLSALVRKGSIPHALLFTGPEGVGKQSTAMMFAMTCNCREMAVGHLESRLPAYEPCGICRSCKKIQSGNHPDISVTEPSGPFIRIDQVRALCHTLGMKPFEAAMRVVIITQAQAMNPEAGNALLKVLEEPPDRTVLILTASQTSDLLPTIVSRCQHIRFDPIHGEALVSLLVREQGLDPDDAALIAALADGSYSKACRMSHANWTNQRTWLVRELESLLESCFLGSRDQEKAFPVARFLAFAEKLSKDKETLSDSLEVMNTWLRDIMVCKLALSSGRGYDPEKMINKDLADRIRHASEKTEARSLLSKTKAIQSAQKNLRANANPRLTLETLIMRLARQ